MKRLWEVTKDGDPAAFALYLRHYSSRKRSPNSKLPLFVGPGEKLVLVTAGGDAAFAWRKMSYSLDGQRGVCCTLFRNESPHHSSRLIQEAMRLAWKRWPGERLYTYVDPKAIRSVNPGFCFKMAKWRTCGQTRRGLRILEMQ
jgi:hypothetical protein